MTFALAVLSLQNAGAAPPAPYRAWQWQRVIEPAATAPVAEQCVVLDAALYTAAAPGLRDVRLLQGGREIAYAVQESYDEGALGSGSRLPNRFDRSLYTTVLRVPLTPLASSDTGMSTGPQRGSGLLPRRVPVERMELVPPSRAPATGERSLPSPRSIHVRFTVKPEPAGLAASPEPNEIGEVIEDYLGADDPVERTAIGANLQDDASVAVDVEGAQRFSSVLLQMHQRSICFQPLSRVPLLLLAGNPAARPVRYDYAVHFQPTATPLLATMGPMQRNSTYHPHAAAPFLLTGTTRLLLATGVALACFLLTVGLLRPRI